MLLLISAFLNKYLAYIRWGVLAVWSLGLVWSTHHIDVLADKAAKADHVENIANSIPEVITKTQTITKVIHDAKDSCAVAPIPSTVLEQLH